MPAFNLIEILGLIFLKLVSYGYDSQKGKKITTDQITYYVYSF